jgi:hypothetical protein
MTKPTKRQKGAQQHAEGGHGARTTRAIRVEMTSGSPRADEANPRTGAPRLGRHKIYEDRQQHDEADKNAEKRRLERDVAAGRVDERSRRRGERSR